MAAVIRSKANVGTTYKRALTKKILVRDRRGSLCVTVPEAIGSRHRYVRSATCKESAMRKPRDFDSALRALTDKTKVLKENKRRQLGELIVATGADALDMETLAGGLLTMVNTDDAVQKESWRKRGAAFFRGTVHQSAGKSRGDPRGGSASDSVQTSA